MAQHFQVVCILFRKRAGLGVLLLAVPSSEKENVLVQWGKNTMTWPSKRRIGQGQHCHSGTSLMHVRPLCRRAFHHFGCCLFEKCSFSHKCYTCGFPHAARTCCSSWQPFLGSQALAADCHKPEAIWQHTWSGRVADSTTQLPRSRFMYGKNRHKKKHLGLSPFSQKTSASSVSNGMASSIVIVIQ